jgi:hypothetical protein
VLEALLVQDSANRKFMPTLQPIVDGLYSTNYGNDRPVQRRELRFTKESSSPPGGTPVVAAASGKSSSRGSRPYGKMSRSTTATARVAYAHARSFREGGRPRRARPAVRRSGRPGVRRPHLHFEVAERVPQNPARFLQRTG